MTTDEVSVPVAAAAKPLTRTDIAYGVFYGMLLFSAVALAAGLVIGLVIEMLKPIG